MHFLFSINPSFEIWELDFPFHGVCVFFVEGENAMHLSVVKRVLNFSFTVLKLDIFSVFLLGFLIQNDVHCTKIQRNGNYFKHHPHLNLNNNRESDWWSQEKTFSLSTCTYNAVQRRSTPDIRTQKSIHLDQAGIFCFPFSLLWSRKIAKIFTTKMNAILITEHQLDSYE